MLTSEEFVRHLRDALNHLYDPDRLRQSPLATLFGVADRFDTPSRLQQILTEALEPLKPTAGEPLQSPTRRIYDLLLYRYVQQFSQREVADQLGISVRQLRREQRVALDALAERIWEQLDLEQRLHGQAGVEIPPGQKATDAPFVNDELAWLKDALPESGVDLQDVLPAVLDLSRPLADRYRVRLEITWADALPNLAVHPVALRQILLNLLGMAIHRAAGGRVCISVRPLQWEVRIRVQSVGGETAETAQAPSGLDMTDRLVSLCAGKLDFLEDEESFAAALTLPAHERLPVLVIDDNTDALQLLKRYALGTRYRLVGTRDPEQALHLAEKLSPQIVVLDVMMPEVDGWVVLGQLRQHPLTSHVPIVVCTILAQEELALSLGASDFVRKPITRQSFLAALDRQVTRMGTKPR